MTQILLVGDSHAGSDDLSKLLASSGFGVTYVESSKLAFDSLQEHLPDVVLIDLDAPGNDGLTLVKAIHKAFPAVPVILMSASVADDVTAALRQGGTAYLRKHNAARELARTVESVLTVAQLLSGKAKVLDCLNNAEFSFVLGNDVAEISPLLSCVEQIASLLHPCDPSDRMRVNMALNETLLNAIQHGNLELSSELRQQDEAIFRKLGNERKNLPPFNTRRTFLRATLSRSEAIYTIEDEGNGFDPGKIADASDEKNLGRIGGRGLLLIRAFMDEVQFNEKGNRVTLRKRYSTTDCPT